MSDVLTHKSVCASKKVLPASALIGLSRALNFPSLDGANWEEKFWRRKRLLFQLEESQLLFGLFHTWLIMLLVGVCQNAECYVYKIYIPTMIT
jgi:hypothetical protein